MTTPPPPTFEPPTPEQLAAHLEQYPPRPLSPWNIWGPLGLVALATLIGLTAGGALAMLLPWLGVMVLLAMLSHRVRQARELEAQTTRTQEMALLRHFPQALRSAWRLLPKLVHNPLLHARVVALMAHCLDQVKQYDAALTGYDYLIHHLPDDNPGVVQLRVQRAVVALQSDHLTDADDTLRKLRGVIERYRGIPGNAAAAGYRLAQLLQQVRTHHFADAVAENEDLLDALRPLGVEAGYGHALLALAYHAAPGLDADAAARSAGLWWRRATLLLPEATLLDRFPELAPLARPSTEAPNE